MITFSSHIYSTMNVGYRMSYLLQIPVEILGLIKSRVPEGLFLTNTHHYAMIHRTMGISHVFLNKYPCETRKSFKQSEIFSPSLRKLVKYGYFKDLHYIVPMILCSKNHQWVFWQKTLCGTPIYNCLFRQLCFCPKKNLAEQICGLLFSIVFLEYIRRRTTIG